ncbi:hypothetical protein BDD43_6050 [Mucilaginibacter gracilis]|uniref:Tetratricopeptide repeat protein n=1 Tax=Mucilaginibacter gracilis TaxID=423350 RepID=A0A495JBJ9_9SPHI|nr:hypothetical protein [Mucilaginibacter gracilis]RKR85774.1 hypothetical protein BDD43_6050 [Mucilaginibacter gracilis]
MPDSFFELAMTNAMSLYQQASLKKAIEYGEKALNIAEKAGDITNFLRALEMLMGLYFETGDDEQVLDAAQTIINASLVVLDDDASNILGQSFLCSAYTGIGRVARKQLDFEKAREYLLQRYNVTYNWLYKPSDSIRPLSLKKFLHASSCEHLCEMFIFLNDKDNSMIYSQEYANLTTELVKEDAESVQYQLLYIMAFYCLGKSYYLADKLDEAMHNLTVALSASTAMGQGLPNSFEFAGTHLVILETLGEFSEKQQDYEKALGYYNEQFIITKKFHLINKFNVDTTFNHGNAACKLADINIKLDKLDDALPYLQQIEEIFTVLTADPNAGLSHFHELYYGYATFIDYYQKKGDWTLALKYANKTVHTLEKMVEMVENDPNFRPRYTRLLRQYLNKAAKICETMDDKPMARKFEARANAVK